MICSINSIFNKIIHLRIKKYCKYFNNILLTSWIGIFFQSPSNSMIQSLILIHDLLILFLFSILIVVGFVFFFSFLINNFYLFFLENDELEFVWTVVPFILLLFIITPSIKSLYFLDVCLNCGISIVILGHQWYWSYFIKDFNLIFDSYIVQTHFNRLLEVDNCLILPSEIPIQCFLSSEDVIHSWTIPSMGLKIDAVPGRINQFCFNRTRSGIFFGQCSEICGINHRFIPIKVEFILLSSFLKLI